jgi:hypothetical protein
MLLKTLSAVNKGISKKCAVPAIILSGNFN